MYKKNLIFRVAIITFILVIATTSLISGTFAKYSWTSGAVSDSARVAIFDFTVKDQQNTEYTTEGNRIDIFGDVDSSGKKELYPDDEGSFDIIVINTSEVTVEAVIDARLVGTNNEEIVPNILFNLDGSENYLPLADVLAQLNASDTFKDISFPSPNGFNQESVTIHWKWISGGNDSSLPSTMAIRMEIDATINQVD